MRTLSTLGVVRATLLALSALEWVAGGAAQAQQPGPPARTEALEAEASGGLNLLQQAPLNPYLKYHLVGGVEGLAPPANSPPTSDSPSNYLLSVPASEWRILLPGRELDPGEFRPYNMFSVGDDAR